MYCVICDGYGFLHAPCPKCGLYRKLGTYIQGISPGHMEEETKSGSSTVQGIDIINTSPRAMPDSLSWSKIRKVCKNGYCEEHKLGLKCPLRFSRIQYGKSSIDVYVCNWCLCQFFDEDVIKLVEADKGMKEDKP